ncbi:MAG TPA: nicotinate-nucleotide adenylyltransferase [Syntrophorhabdaceae bacterium]|jgi:nicotinate-nucleotide adenylyltransferase|nr:nicotinate-nucleotide adenylyltransferase [Syntrophorhabdaceae bacterium]HPH41660.1 nicotinate-nucleotide adenylyltransferase [Syntrophorhabdaceae bacterium]HPN98255.1 nicotinate-nucleotide adenylyltransferase [Syntrophorhabdaceae bacterium]HQG51056.1 nicotinate-nucleotide adenylyltransferase [Syntrophorhabdaceae bacterium]HQI56427.1 nicotinate-nucleotide adenylyltransferase [Syntrophorhabdaceae bacterium]
MMRIGLFGGTFDPVHIGHLRVAEEIREAFELERVYFIPANIPPHKNIQLITDSDIRLKMIKSAVRDNKYLSVSDIELKRKGVSYSIDTVRSFEKRFKSLYFIMGIDAFYEIDTWYDYKEIFNHTNFIVMLRPMDRKPGASDVFPNSLKTHIKKIDDVRFQHSSGNMIYLQQVTQLDISSTRIRENIKQGKTTRYIVPKTVEKIVREKGLYRT